MNPLLFVVGAALCVAARASDEQLLTSKAVHDFHAELGWAGGLCGNLEVPCGAYIAKDAVGKTRSRVKLRAGTVKDALQQVVARNPNYTWVVEDGVINILPKSGHQQLDSGLSPLEKFLPTIIIANKPTDQAAHMILEEAGLRVGGRLQAGGHYYYGIVSLNLKGITVRQALNQLVKIDGAASWQLAYNPDRKEYVVDIFSWRKGASLFQPKK